MSQQTSPLPRGRTIPISGEWVRTLRIQKKWDVGELAAAAKISDKTIENIEKGGKSVYAATFVKIAAALEVDNAKLLPTPVRVIIPETPLRRPVHVILRFDLPYHLFDQSDHLNGTLAFIKSELLDKHDFNVVAVFAGSVNVELEMSYDDALRLYAAFEERHLSGLRVGALTIPDPEMLSSIKADYQRMKTAKGRAKEKAWRDKPIPLVATSVPQPPEESPAPLLKPDDPLWVKNLISLVNKLFERFRSGTRR